jgi:hypothetical protein
MEHAAVAYIGVGMIFVAMQCEDSWTKARQHEPPMPRGFFLVGVVIDVLIWPISFALSFLDRGKR